MKTIKIIILLLIIIFIYSNCTSEKQQGIIPEIESYQEFEKIIKENKDILIIIDLYANWCHPCRILSPRLENVAKQKKTLALFYKIDIDKLKQVASLFQVKGIPYVVFLKNQKIIYSITGVRSESAYIKAIDKFSTKENTTI